MLPAKQARVAEEEYILREQRSVDKHELVNGEIVAMAGGSPRHNAIAMNVGVALKGRLRGRRRIVFNSDQRIHVEETGLYTYADVSVACDRLRFHPTYPDNLLNPRVVVEVLSKSTEGYDRGAKFAHYQRITDFVEYVLVGQAERRVEHFRRLESGQWLLTVYEGGTATIALPTLACEVPLDELYEGVDLLDETEAEAEAAPG
jgi:Uma2 family endonuclease